MSFPKILRRTISINDFGKSYDTLFGFGITMVIDILKWAGQWPSSKQALAILMIPFKHNLFLRICLRCLHESLFRPGADELLHFAIKPLTCRSCAILKVKYKVCHRSCILRYSYLLYLTASIARSLCLWTQFISFQGLCFLLEISWILRSKKEYLVFLIVLLNCFQSFNLLEVLYMLRSLL